MKAREYLFQLKRLEHTIQWYSEESARIRGILLPKGITYDGDKVQTSVSDRVTEDIAKLIDIDNKYMKMIRIYHEKRNLIITQINGLPNQNHVDLLVKVYLNNKPLEIVGDEMGYSYDWVRHMHTDALKDFERQYSDILKDNTKKHIWT